MKMQNSETGELAPVHYLGTDGDGNKIVVHVEGWELVHEDGSPCIDGDYSYDEDGNYILASD